MSSDTKATRKRLAKAVIGVSMVSTGDGANATGVLVTREIRRGGDARAAERAALSTARSLWRAIYGAGTLPAQTMVQVTEVRS